MTSYFCGDDDGVEALQRTEITNFAEDISAIEPSSSSLSYFESLNGAH